MRPGIDISIVIPAYNESRFIQQTLTRLLAVVDPARIALEVLVVDNGSTDRTASIAKTFSGVHVLKLQQRRTISAARNAGADLAKGRLLVFVDADVLVTERWAENLYRRAGELASADAISGAQYRISEEPGWIERYWFKSMEERRPNYINGGNLIVGKSAFERLGGFCADLVTGEDVELCRRAGKAGFAIDPDPEFMVHHEGYPKSLLSFFKRELWTGRGDMSSLTAFAQSKTAVTAVTVVLLLATAMALLIAKSWYLSAAVALIVVGIAMASVYYKYGIHSGARLLVNTFVMIVHLVARALAFVNFEKKA